ncbi:MAG: hypothetical protein ACMXYE_03115 [Candidatus Woesearchaeota archaeon]
MRSKKKKGVLFSVDAMFALVATAIFIGIIFMRLTSPQLDSIAPSIEIVSSFATMLVYDGVLAQTVFEDNQTLLQERLDVLLEQQWCVNVTIFTDTELSAQTPECTQNAFMTQKFVGFYADEHLIARVRMWVRS